MVRSPLLLPPSPRVGAHALAATLTMVLAGILWGCGPAIDDALLTSSNDRSLPTMDNYPLWKRQWKKGSWIVAVRDAAWRSGMETRRQMYRARTAQSFVTGAQRLLEGTGRSLGDPAAFASVIDRSLSLDLMGHDALLPPLPALADNDREVAFLAVTLSDEAAVGLRLADHAGMTLPDLTRWFGLSAAGDPARMLAHWQQDSLATVEGSLWVEPDIYSTWSTKQSLAAPGAALDDAVAPRTATPYTPPEFEFRSSGPIGRLRLIKADLAYNYTGQGVKDRRPINVAVLDTGVDDKHPDLENQMWVNDEEAKAPGNNQDDDRNGFKDDIHGIDATLAPGDDGGLAPRPGSADLGGPGVACPSAPASQNPDGDKLLDNCGHGSHVAGIIAAQHGADTKTLGVCPNCRIMSIRVAERCVQPDTKRKGGDCVLPRSPLREDQYEVDGNISDAAQIRALLYLFNTRSSANRGSLAVNIVNMSLGKYFRSRSMAYRLQKLQDSNVAIVAAAGNDDTDTPSFPAAYEAVVAVCATSINGKRGDYAKADFSNFGEWVDICAPGEDIVSTVPGRQGSSGNTIDKDGTSQATPFVSGALGYLMSVADTQKDVRQLINVLKKAATSSLLYNDKANLIAGTSDPAYIACYRDRSSCDYLLGTGFLNLHKAVNPQAAGESFSEVDLNKARPVAGGCVVSAVGSGQHSWMGFWTSMPVVLGQFMAAIFLSRRSGRKLRTRPL